MTNHKILIVDDHELIVHGISTLLAPYPRFEISGHTVDGRDVYNALIGEQLHISIKTVETHRLNIMRKLNVHKVTELMNCAQRLGLITWM